MLTCSTTVAPLLLSLLLAVCSGFVARHLSRSSPPTATRTRTRSSTKLFGIEEWRDEFYPTAGGGSFPTTATTVHNDIAPPKPICLLPFPYEDVLLQGETKQLRLYEDRFIQLFDTVMEQHHGVLAMALFADDQGGVISSVPVVEVEAYNRMVPGLGIFATVRVVGRASLTSIQQQDPFLIGTCQELVDTSIGTKEYLSDANIMADVIESTIQDLTALEERFETADPQDLTKIIEASSDTAIDHDLSKRVQQAKLDQDYFEDEDDDWEDEENDDKNDDDDDDMYKYDSDADVIGSDDNLDLTSTRASRYALAKEAATWSDTQGYMCHIQDEEDDFCSSSYKSLQELTAISWAGLSTEMAQQVDATYRLQALDETSLLDRLHLTSKLLLEKRRILQSTWEQFLEANNNKKGDSGDNSSSESGEMGL